jgi:hypothetical protein
VRRLEKSGVGRGYEVPPKGVEISGEDVRCVEPLAGKMPPVSLLQDLGINFALPKNREALALRVIFETGEIDERLFPPKLTRGLYSVHQVSPAANLHDLAK